MINWRNFDLLLFDMDGTLANSEPLHNQAICLILERFHCQYQPQALGHELRGFTDFQVYQELVARYPGLEMQLRSPQEFLALKNNFLGKLLPSANWEQLLTPGVIPFLQQVKKAPKKIGLVSASDNPIVDLTLRSLHLSSVFDLIIGNQDVTFSKPHPAPYLQAMDYFHMPAHRVLIFEDSANGIKAALASSASVIQITQWAPIFPGVCTTENFLSMLQMHA